MLDSQRGKEGEANMIRTNESGTRPKPRTDKQKEAARANGRRSSGPKTEAGKAISARNAVRHGLRASENHICEWESVEDWKALHDATVRRFRPADMQEYHLVAQLASYQWRMTRHSLQTTQTLNDAAHNDFLIQRNPGRGPDEICVMSLRKERGSAHSIPASMNREEAHVHRIWEKAARDLYYLQTVARQAPPPNQPDPVDAPWLGFLKEPKTENCTNEPGKVLPDSLQTVQSKELLPLPGYQPADEPLCLPQVPRPAGDNCRLLKDIVPLSGERLTPLPECQRPGNNRSVDIPGPRELPRLPDVLAKDNPSLQALPKPPALQSLPRRPTIGRQSGIRNRHPIRPSQVLPLQSFARPQGNSSPGIHHQLPAEPLGKSPVSRQKDIEIGP